jgi:hypothetical protein
MLLAFGGLTEAAMAWYLDRPFSVLEAYVNGIGSGVLGLLVFRCRLKNVERDETDK